MISVFRRSLLFDSPLPGMTLFLRGWPRTRKIVLECYDNETKRHRFLLFSDNGRTPCKFPRDIKSL